MTTPIDDRPRTRAERLAAVHSLRIRARIRVAAGSLAVLLGTGGLLLAAPGGSARAAAAGSAVTVGGGPAFPNLKVTVGQTKDLINQVVSVNWTGGAPTYPGGGQFGVNYLQIMQCWGDDPVKGPDRSQCQFGATNDARGGYAANKRQVTYGVALKDPNEALTAPPTGSASVPFLAVDNTTIAGDALNPYYDASTTNEIPFAQTAGDGTGQAFFEMETAREAPGLGCGQALTDAQGKTFGRPCWLVIVPRDNTEVDGSVRVGTTNDNSLVSSPLSQTNWDRRITVPLTFVPLTQPCPFGYTDRNTLGQEQMAEAMMHWQPALCAANPISYSYTQNTDDLARAKLASTDPGLVFLSRAVAQGTAMPNGPPVYAPIALSGYTIAFNIESQSSFSAPAPVQQMNGTRITGLNLTPRLVAKLLTQSYATGVSAGDPAFQTGGALAKNYYDLTRDPEFLAANPAFAGLTFYAGIGDIMSPLVPSDAVTALWQWITSDADARAFLAGNPDPNGMVVNPAYKNLALPQEIVPKLDTYCQIYPPVGATQPTPLCTLDLHPYFSTNHAAARGAARGDKLAKTAWNPFNQPPNYGSTPAQPAGLRAVLTLTDTATAARYSLQTAALRNGAGAFVVPDQASMLASAAAPVQVDGIAVPDPATKAAGAYPLTTITYAATVPAQLTAPVGADYASFLDFAVNAGQTPGPGAGQLPDGYTPLPAALHDQAVFAAGKIKSQAGIPVGPSGTPNGSGPATQGSTTPGGGATLLPPSSGPAGTGPPYTLPSAAGPAQLLNVDVPGAPFTHPLGGATGPGGSPAAPVPSGTVKPAATKTSAAPSGVAKVITPLTRLGAVRFSLLVLLILGGVLALAGPALRFWAAKIPHRAVPSGVHLE